MFRNYKSILVACTFFIFIIIGQQSMVRAIDIRDGQEVECYKDWVIKFNRDVTLEDLNRTKIKVTNSKGRLALIDLRTGDDKKSITIKAPQDGYEKGETYKLTIEKDCIKNSDLNKDINMNFKIKNSYFNNGNTEDNEKNTPVIYYVSNSGNDDGKGDEKDPFKTIQHAVNVMKAGDTLLIREGNYCEKVNIAHQNGSDSKWYTIKAYPGENVTLHGNDIVDEGIVFFDCSYWNVENLNITKYTNVGVYLRSGCHHFNMDRLKIWDLNYHTYIPQGVEGILGEGFTSYCTVQNSEIFNVGLELDKPKDHGIYVGYGAENWNFYNNYIHDNSGAGIQMYGEPTGGTNCTVKGNNLSNNHQWGLVLGGSANDNTITGNQFYGNKDCDVYILSSSHGNKFFYNKFGSKDAVYNIAMGDDASLDNKFDYNVYEKFDGRSVFMAHYTINFSQWQSYSQELHGSFSDK